MALTHTGSSRMFDYFFERLSTFYVVCQRFDVNKVHEECSTHDLQHFGSKMSVYSADIGLQILQKKCFLGSESWNYSYSTHRIPHTLSNNSNLL